MHEQVEQKIKDANKILDEAEAIMQGKAPAKTTELVLILDRSGSMSNLADEVNGSVARFLEEQRGLQGDCRFTLALFDDKYEVPIRREPLQQVGGVQCVPRGMTALLDAIGRTLNDLGVEVTKAECKVCVIVTDGMENASIEWTRQKVFDLIERRKQEGWQFIFMAANQDAIGVGSQYGFRAAQSTNYAATGQGVSNSCAAMSRNVKQFRATANRQSLSFTDEQREKSNAE